MTAGRRRALALGAVVAWSLVLLWLARRSGVLHDYAAYVTEWNALVDDDPATAPLNAYGPLHYVLGHAVRLGTMAPKYLMLAGFLVANLALAVVLTSRDALAVFRVPYLLLVPLDLVVVLVVAHYGLNDTVVAAFVLGAVVARAGGRSVLAGALLGLASLAKYYPLLVLPAFALDGRRFDRRVVAGAAGVFAAGMAVAALSGADGMWHGLTYGADRDAKMLSVLSALTTVLGPENGVLRFLLSANVAMVAGAVVVATVVVWRWRVHWLPATAVVYLVELTVYRVGHTQFHVPLFLLAAAFPLWADRRSTALRWVFVPWAVFLSLHIGFYTWGSDGYVTELRWVRDYGGFGAFAVCAGTVAAALWVLRPAALRSVGDGAARRGDGPAPVGGRRAAVPVGDDAPA